jgi:hypothetical protein
MRLFYFFAIIMLLLSCGNHTGGPDVSNIKMDIKIRRMEQDFFKIDTLHPAGGLAAVQAKYPYFTPFFLANILGIRNNAATDSNLVAFIRWYASVNEAAQKTFPKVGPLEKELEKDFKYVKYYYPKYQILPVITYVGPFEAPGVILTPDNIAIGLQQFLGKDFPAYGSEAIQQMYPAYISRRFEAAYVPANCVKAIADDIYPDSSHGLTLIEQMIEKGKQWYMLDRFMPGTADSLKTGFTQKALDWCKANEGNIWGFINSTTDLYTIDMETVQTFIGESPTTQGMPEASPGNIGQWTGWQIVKKFASQQPSLTLQQLLATPAKKLFAEAKYKPK